MAELNWCTRQEPSMRALEQPKTGHVCLKLEISLAPLTWTGKAVHGLPGKVSGKALQSRPFSAVRIRYPSTMIY